MSSFTMIRQALESDCTAIAACAKAAYDMYIDRIGKPPAPMVADFASQILENKVQVLERRQQLIGYVVSFPVTPISVTDTSIYFIENIAVHPTHQGAGLGKLLINQVIVSARQCNCNTIELYTNELMVENIVWYNRLGFREFDRRQEDGFSRVYLRLKLTDS